MTPTDVSLANPDRLTPTETPAVSTRDRRGLWLFLLVLGVVLAVLALGALANQPWSQGASLASNEPDRLKYPDAVRALQYDNGAWAERFHSETAINTQPALSLAVWWLLHVVVGWLVWPLLYALTPRLADRGYGFAKGVGLLLVAWFGWYGASLGLPLWSQGGLLLGLALLAVVSAVVVWRNAAEIVAYVRAHGRALLAFEVIALAAFGALLVVRLVNPDLWQSQLGNEKPMDFAYFNGVLRSTVFPPIDPWYAGGFLNYYYFGFVLAGAPVLLLGLVPAIAYNLIIPTLFAFAASAAFSVAFNLASAWRETHPPTDEAPARRLNPWLAGSAALLFAVVLGNLDAPRLVLTDLATLGGYDARASYLGELVTQYVADNGAEPDADALADLRQQAAQPSPFDRLRFDLSNTGPALSGIVNGLGRLASGDGALSLTPYDWLWGPTRVYAVPPEGAENGITEAPAFSFMSGDLHAHVVSMALQLALLGLLLNHVLGAKNRVRLVHLGALVLVGLIVGLFRAINTWEWPTYSLLVVAVLVYAGQRARQSIGLVALQIAVFAAVNVVAVLPYSLSYAAIYGAASFWQGYHSSLLAYLDVHGLFLFLLASLAALETRRWLAQPVTPAEARYRRLARLALVGTAVVAVVLVFLGYGALLVAVPALVWLFVLVLRPGQTTIVQFLLLLAAFALLMTVGVEFVALAGDEGRQNTVFKLYTQVWLILSVVAGTALAVLLSAQPRRRWLVALWLLLGIAAVFPVTTFLTRAAYRMAPQTPLTLDGLAFLRYAAHQDGHPDLVQANPALGRFPLDEDLALIDWLQENDTGASVVMEGRSRQDYSWGSRIASYTGNPTVVGWRWHQTQQRTLAGMPEAVQTRINHVNGFYATTDFEQALLVLQRYEVTYVVVGRLERAYYPAESLQKFDLMVEQGLLEVVLQAGESRLYRVLEPGEGQRLF